MRQQKKIKLRCGFLQAMNLYCTSNSNIQHINQQNALCKIQ